MKIFFGEYQSWLARVTNVFLFGSGVCLVWMLAGCAAEPDLVDLKKQVQKLSENQQDFQKHNQHLLERVETIESKVDEHDFLVGELITTEEEASLDTRHLQTERVGPEGKPLLQIRDGDSDVVDLLDHRTSTRSMICLVAE